MRINVRAFVKKRVLYTHKKRVNIVNLVRRWETYGESSEEDKVKYSHRSYKMRHSMRVSEIAYASRR